MAAIGAELERLVEVMRRLRAENGCPWDREQDLRSLRPYLIEEAYEVLDEMDRVGAGGSWKPFCEELGDLLFQIVFHAQLASELGEFNMGDVARAIADKIVSRHPHVFGDVQVKNAEHVLQNWAVLKAAERKKKTGSEGSVLDGVPTGAPALQRAERLTEKASRIGFDWPNLEGVREKLAEELRELDEAIASNDRDQKEHELGDVLFSLANLARFIQTPAEDALRVANHRFTERFHHIEQGLRDQGVPFGKASLEQMEALWQDAKVKEKSVPKPLPAEARRPHARAHLAELALPQPDLVKGRVFWDALAPKLGLRILSGRPDAARYSDGQLTFRLVPAQGPVSPVILGFGAPSQAAVQALFAVLKDQGAELLEDGRLSIPDPAGHRIDYAFPAGQ